MSFFFQRMLVAFLCLIHPGVFMVHLGLLTWNFKWDLVKDIVSTPECVVSLRTGSVVTKQCVPTWDEGVYAMLSRH